MACHYGGGFSYFLLAEDESRTMKKEIDWPTERHKAFGEHVLNVCMANEIGLLLKGSIANGTARPYSDIDVSIYGNVSKDIIERILYGFEKPLLINASEKPPGLLIVAYRKGLALDLGIQGGDSIDENGESILLVRPSNPGHRMLSSTEEYVKAIGRNDHYSKTCKLIHKGLLKYLSGKRDVAGEFIKEIIEFTAIQISDQGNIIEAFQTSVRTFIRNDDVMRQEFHWLIQEATRK
jgi:hypothetical protein